MMLNHLRFLRRLRVEVDRGQSPADAIRNARPRPHFSREATMTQQLRLWRDDMLSRGTQRVLAATAESRKTPALAEVTLRRTLHAICQTAAQA